MNTSLIVILLMALTVTVAIGIAMANIGAEGNRLWLFEAEDPRQEKTVLKFEVRGNTYTEALNAANEVRHMYRENGVEFNWKVAYELDPKSKNKIAKVFSQKEIGIEKTIR